MIPRRLRRFGISVPMGTATAAALPACFTIALAIPSLFAPGCWEERFVMLRFAAAPFLLSFPLVLVGRLFIGLPATAILRHFGRESDRAYVLTGAVGGLPMPLPAPAMIGIDLSVAPLFYALGLVSGAAAGHSWWIERPGRA